MSVTSDEVWGSAVSLITHGSMVALGSRSTAGSRCVCSFAFHFLSASVMLQGSSSVFQESRLAAPALPTPSAQAQWGHLRPSRDCFIRVIHYQTAAVHEAFAWCFPFASKIASPFPCVKLNQGIFISYLCSLWEHGPRTISYYRNLSGFSWHRLSCIALNIMAAARG